MNYYKQHQVLLKKVLIALQKKYPNGRFFQRTVGFFKTVRGTPVRINKKGMADLWGVIDGKHYEFEIKTGNGKQSKDQKNWENTVTSFGAKYFLIRSLKDVECLEL